MAVIFWSEFPGQLNFNKLNKLINFDTTIYFAVKSVKDYSAIKNKIKNKKIQVGAWPILDKEQGYWFSGFIKKSQIDKLDQFKDIKMKIDLEPPIYHGKHSLIKDIAWFSRYIIKKGKNNQYLEDKIKKLNKNILLSGFLLPKFIRKRYSINKDQDNYICYMTFFPRIIRPLIRWLCKIIINNMDKSNFYAIGLTNPGIFGNEATYKNINEFRKDLKMVKKVKNLCLYSIEGIIKKPDAIQWLDLIASSQDK